MTAIELKTVRDALRERLRYLDSAKMICNDCENWQGSHCGLYDETPPAEFQRTPEACPEWKWDEVPFIISLNYYSIPSSKERRMSRCEFK